MRILVCGGREFDNWERIDTELGFYAATSGIETIIQGGAKGADFLAKAWAKYKGIPVDEWPADWKAHGKAAGGIRNQKMLDEGRPNIVLAFPGGRGTADMTSRAQRAGVRVVVL